MDAELLALLRQTVTVEPLVSRDQGNKPTYGAAIEFSPENENGGARVVYRPQRVRGADGNEHVSRGHVWLGPAAKDTGLDARLTLDDGTTPPLLAIETYPDEHGEVDHVKLFFG